MFKNNKINKIKSSMKEKDFITRKQSILGSLVGGGVGDALGYQIEFKKDVQDKEVTSYKNNLGLISDDTQMTLFTANALLWRDTRLALKGISLSTVDAIYEAYLDWYDTQMKSNKHSSISWIKEEKDLNVQRAPSNTCLTALSSGNMGTIEHPINDSKGCGGIMRVAPIGLYSNSDENAGLYAAQASAITHGHPLGNIPSYVLSVMIYYLVNFDISINNSLDLAISLLKKKFNVYESKYNKEFIELVELAKELSKNNENDIVNISNLGEGWVAEEAFAIAVYSCLKYEKDFKQAVICAVNHKGDSDSTGAIAGNIIGAYLGIDSIPKYYVDNLELKNVIFELAEDLSIPIPVSEYSENNDEYWLKKYLYCKK